MPRGSLNLKLIDELSEVIYEQELEIEIWVPEPVLWEWSEHVAGALSQTRDPYKKAVLRARDAGHEVEILEWQQNAASVDVVVASITEALDLAECRILLLQDHPDAAISAIRDQILQVGVGRKKSESASVRVKTGAADSASFRLISAHAGSDLPRVALISTDRDARGHFIGSQGPIHVKDIWQAKRELLRLKKGTDVAVAELIEAIEEQLVFKDRVDFARASVDQERGALRNIEWDWGRYLDTKLTVESVERVCEVISHDLSRNSEYATAEVSVVLSAQLEGTWWDSDAEDLIHEQEALYGVDAVAEIYAEKDGNGWDIEVDRIILGEAR